MTNRVARILYKFYSMYSGSSSYPSKLFWQIRRRGRIRRNRFLFPIWQQNPNIYLIHWIRAMWKIYEIQGFISLELWKKFCDFFAQFELWFFSEKILKNQNKFCKIYITFISPPSEIKKVIWHFMKKQQPFRRNRRIASKSLTDW